MSNILVTGGAGFIGSHLVERLLKERHSIIVIDNLIRGKRSNLVAATKHNGEKLRFVEADIRNAHLLDSLIARVDYVFHLAALRINMCAEDPNEARSVMVNGTMNIIQSCIKHDIKKLIYASSASIYGTADKFPTPETHHPYNDQTLYGAFKLCGEGMLRAFAQDGLCYIALRFFNVYGPRMDIYGKYTEVMIKWLELIDKKSRPIIYGDGSQTLDFVYVDDVVDALILSQKSAICNETLNIGSRDETSLLELANLLLRLRESNLEPICDTERAVSTGVNRRKADWQKAKRLLDWHPKTMLSEGLLKLIDWRNEQQRRNIYRC